MKDHALALAAAGLHVFPLRERDKVPVTTNGFKDATADPAKIAAMWADRWDGTPCRHNVGVACEPSGLVVIDLDGDEGVARRGQFPPTLTALTGKGLHLYYSGKGRSTVRTLGPGIDTRGNGGYVVAPPSVHPNGHRYRWEDPEVPIRPLPNFAAQRLAPVKRTAKRRKPDPQMRTVLIWAAVQRLRNTTEGGRNNALNREVWGVRDCEDPQYIAVLFVAEGEALGLPHDECVRTVASALGASPQEVEGWL